MNKDERGVFSEIFKNTHIGQLSFFTISPNEMRGNHFHHSKCEIFLVLYGSPLFTLFNLKNNKVINIKTKAKNNQLIQIPPGYMHQIINTAKTPCLVLVWASEIFNKKKPDTYVIN